MTGGEPAGRRRVLAVIVLVGALLRVALGAERPIWIDEAYQLVWSHGCRQLDFYDVRSSDLCINQPPRKLADVLRGIAPFEPPLTAVLLNRWMRATGAAADLPIRVPLITLGVLAIVGFYLLGADLYGVRTGVVAALLLALSPFTSTSPRRSTTTPSAPAAQSSRTCSTFGCCVAGARATPLPTSSAPAPRS